MFFILKNKEYEAVGACEVMCQGGHSHVRIRGNEDKGCLKGLGCFLSCF